MWDSSQPQDQRGDEILDWILDNDLHILNDGSATRTSQITGNDSTPDISLCGSNWSAKTSCRLAEPIGSSDHLPIIIEVNHKICYKLVIPRSARWCRNGVDWDCFTNEVESKTRILPHEPNLSLRVSRFNEILISAATTHVGKSKPSKRSKTWMTPHVRAKICTRNCLHRTIHQNRQEWIDACHEATEAINEAKSESWKDLLQDVMSNSNSSNIWKVIQGLNGTPDANSPKEAIPTTVELSMISNRNLTYSSTTMPGSANSTCRDPTVISTCNSKNVSTHHLLTMKAVLHSSWVNYNLPTKG